MEILKLQTIKTKGQLLIEVLVAVAIIILVLVGASALTSGSIKSVRVTDERSEAAKLALSQMNFIEKSLSVLEMFNLLGDEVVVPRNCLIEETTSNIFLCNINIKKIVGEPNSLMVVVVISWSDQEYSLSKKFEK